MDDGFLGMVVAFIVAALTTCGAAFMVMDFRYFGTIAAQCEERGYIQSNTVRIKCTIEK